MTQEKGICKKHKKTVWDFCPECEKTDIDFLIEMEEKEAEELRFWGKPDSVKRRVKV